MNRVGWILIAMPVLIRAIAFLDDVWSKLSLPMESFFLEASMVYRTWRVQEGLSLYPDWKVFPYVHNFFGPLYFVATGWIGRFMDSDIPQLFLVGRLVSLLSALIISVIVGVWLGRIFKSAKAGLLGGITTLGSAPLFGFAEMARPDLLADSLGLLGFIVATAQTRKVWIWSGLLFVLAVFTKQTAVLYLFATALALGFSQGWRKSLWVFGSSVLAILVITIFVTLTVEPGFFKALLGESVMPTGWTHWKAVLERLVTLSPDLVIAAVVGIVFWSRKSTDGSPKQCGWVWFALVLLIGSLAASSKRGADQNYFLCLRFIESMVLVSLIARCSSAHSSGSSFKKTCLALVCSVVLIPSAWNACSEAYRSRKNSEFLGLNVGRTVLLSYQRFFQWAKDPKTPLLTDSGLIALHQGKNAPFVDPWSFRMLVDLGQIDPQELRHNIETEHYDWLILTSELESTIYESYEFGLPRVLYEPARLHYRRVDQRAGLFLYTPRSRTVLPK